MPPIWWSPIGKLVMIFFNSPSTPSISHMCLEYSGMYIFLFSAQYPISFMTKPNIPTPMSLRCLPVLSKTFT